MEWARELAESVNHLEEKSREDRQYRLYRDRLYAAKIPLVWKSCVAIIEKAVEIFNLAITHDHNTIRLFQTSSSTFELKLEMNSYVHRFLEVILDLNARQMFLKDRDPESRQAERRFEFAMSENEAVNIVSGGSSISPDEFAQLVVKMLIKGREVPAYLATWAKTDHADINN